MTGKASLQAEFLDLIGHARDGIKELDIEFILA
jgi:hypothetical protein